MGEDSQVWRVNRFKASLTVVPLKDSAVPGYTELSSSPGEHRECS